jgi:hypothetical protein
MKRHALKIWPKYFGAVLSGAKTFEIRKTDEGREFNRGDLVRLEEWDPATGKYTGAVIMKYITYVSDWADGIKQGYCVFGIGDRP